MPISETDGPDETALRILNLLFALHAASAPLTTEQIIADGDLGYGSRNRESDRRKFKRDRERLAEHGIVVREVRVPGMSETEESSWEIDRERTHAERGALSADDAAIVLAAIDDIFDLHADDPERWPLQRAYLKLEELYGAGTDGIAEPGGRNGRSPVLQTVWDAYMERRPARFTYRDANGGQREHEVELYGTFAQKSRSYLVGFDREAGAVRTFRTDLILRARPAPAAAGTYRIPAGFDVEDYQFLPFDFSGGEAFGAVFSFPADAGRHEIELLTRGRGELRDGPDGWMWRVEVRDVDAAASFCLSHTSLGMRPISPERLIGRWHAAIGRAVEAHGDIEG